MTPPKQKATQIKPASAKRPAAKHTPGSRNKHNKEQISAARKAAFQILLAVERGQSHSDELLRSAAVDALSSPDRNLATALVLGVLRWQILLDHRLQSLLAKPNAKLDPQIHIALRLGAFQLLYLDRIPARAAIDESVELAKQAGHKFASGMVNAVLRKLAAAQPPHFAKENIAELALSFAHPLWMVERWVNSLGMEAARAVCEHGQRQPSHTIRIADTAVEEELISDGVQFKSGELLTASRTVLSGDVTAANAFREGRARLQDEGSQLVAELAGTHPNQKVKTILDCCAAPGGKTLILAERNPQAHILALESSVSRFEQLRQRLAHLGDRVECRHADATALEEDSTFDLVLADVPCSGTGTLGRNPEIRHRLRSEDLTRQADKQRVILRAALRAVRPGGHVVYSTCSLEPEENEQVVAAVLAETPNARLILPAERINELFGGKILTASGAEQLLNCLTPEGYLRLLPGAFDTDGFFVAMIEKRMK